jgi:hypothetical protein
MVSGYDKHEPDPPPIGLRGWLMVIVLTTATSILVILWLAGD